VRNAPCAYYFSVEITLDFRKSQEGSSNPRKALRDIMPGVETKAFHVIPVDLGPGTVTLFRQQRSCMARRLITQQDGPAALYIETR
jgi:hypothetical protein